MIKKIIYIFLGLIFFSYCILSIDKTAPTKTLKVLTYSSFAGLYGPRKDLQKEFESFCECNMVWFVSEDSTALLQRLHLISDIDLVIGLDQFHLWNIKKENWHSIDSIQTSLNKEAMKWKNKFFIPIDWAPIGFIVRNQPFIHALKELPQIEGRLSFPEPKSSSLGLQFYYWIYEAFGGDLNKIQVFLTRLKTRIYGPVFSWSLSYGYFQKGRVDMSLSYLTSLLYHKKEQQDLSYQFAYFKEGHPYQVEFVGVPKSSQNVSLAFEFIKLLLSPQSQNLIQDKHYMLSVLKEQKPPALNRPPLLSYDRMNAFLKDRKNLLKQWKDILY
ncbi:MAG: thiamine ABC transporter substrate-binding protein [Bdellovibrionales bacterium]